MRKAQGALFLTILLVVVVVIIVVSLQFHWSESIERKAELGFEEDLYVISNSLKLGKLYLETSMDYSVYQAMYDAGKNGGWDIKRGDLNLNRDVLESALKTKISENLKKYAEKGYNFLGKIIRLPAYEESGMVIEELADGGLNVTAKGEGNVYFEEITTVSMERKSIKLEVSSNLERIYDSKFFPLHDKSVEVLNGITDCNDGKRIEGDYEVVLEADKDVKPCIVNVSVTDISEEFPVFNGTDVSFEPVTFEYLVGIT